MKLFDEFEESVKEFIKTLKPKTQVYGVATGSRKDDEEICGFTQIRTKKEGEKKKQ
jgi:hypothetical protein